MLLVKMFIVYWYVVSREVVLLRIEKVIENIITSLSCDIAPTIVVANTGTWDNVW